jgi:hypothetical protein
MQPPSLGDLPISLVCAECCREFDEQARGWRAYLALEEDGTDSVETFCEACAVEAFGNG